MSIYHVGKVCVKLAGRDAGKKCVVVEAVDERFVVVDGATRRKKVNVRHLEPLAQTLDIKEKASSAEVKAAFSKLGVAVKESKPRKTAERPKKQKKKAAKPVKEAKKKAPKAEKKSTAEEPAKKEAPVEKEPVKVEAAAQ
ncbi:50S ribosomal protein L14e [Candidatus Woesearchaeota archaeon CG10_big_fil_rev_8_21_14_0_10_45_16]|nr:MAG: 50S ribosomal protein L14e [Candidatus Woesearchaeota archaeon CG10_big_fil_rev_8_21_14_0_10_45_16]